MALSEEAAKAKIAEYTVRGNYLISSVAAIETFLETYDADEHADQVPGRLERLESFYNQYVEVIIQLQLLPAAKPEVEYETQLFRFESRYYEIKGKLSRLMERKPNALGVQSTSRGITAAPTSKNIKYPELKLPEFSGNPLGWRSFHDLFNAAVHSSTDLSASEKFQYLKSLLRGEAAGLISEIPISDANYTEAWQRLVNRFDNKRVLVKCHLAELFDTPPMKQESAEGLLNLVDRFDRNISILKKLGEPTDSWSTILVYQLSLRLDQNSLREWENHIARNAIDKKEPRDRMPKYADMVAFLQGHARVLQAIAPNLTRFRESKVKPPPKNSTLHVSQSSSSSAEATSNRKCGHCGGDHFLYQCFKFRKLSPKQRFDFVKQQHLCLNCMKTTAHGCKDCTSEGCRKCKKKHHTLIHLQPLEPNAASSSSNSSSSQQSTPPSSCPPDSASTNAVASPSGTSSTFVSVHQSSLVPVAPSSTSSQPQSNPPAALVAHSAKLPNDTVLLCTALVYFEDFCGARVVARVLLDSCSQFNLMTESLFQRLKLPALAERTDLGGVGQITTTITRSVETTISSRISAFMKRLKFHVLRTISCDQPVQSLSTMDWEIPSWITLADPTFSTPGPVDALLGAGTFFELLRYGRITLGERLPLLQSTVLGWIVSGECSNRPPSPNQSCLLTQNQKLEQLVARFWDLEQCSSSTCWSPAEKECERHFTTNVSRNEDGRYQVRLPIKQELLPRLGNNKHNAKRRFFALERKLDANPTLRTQYEAFIEEYQRLGHMREVTDEELAAEDDDTPQFFLPHHAILRPDSTTTKLRIVFDASCKSGSGLSLNDVIMTGPTIQDNLNDIVLRFRMPAFVLMGDLCKMYRQILHHPDDQRLLRIYWRQSSLAPLKVFQLLTVTYGTSSAPFLATRVLQQLAEDEKDRFPLAAAVIRKDMYMDDLLTGSNDVEKLKQLCSQLLGIFESAGMQLRKISSNHQEILNEIPEECRETKSLIEFDSDAPVKALGLLWEPATDSLLYKMPKFAKCEQYTKRIILSQTSSCFDPLGLLGPAVVKAKILLQTLWKLDYDWDHPLPKAFADEWEDYQRGFNRLKTFRFPRHAQSLRRPSTVEVHGFSDASEHAYGACLYLRSIAPDGYVTIRLLAAKSRVAPLNFKTIARLELCAALLLSRLLLSVCTSIGISDNIFLWTDSTIVLHWLSGSPSTWQTFVANRVAEVQELTTNCTWQHVPGEENPADLISRGMDIDQLLDDSLWWNGPIWLGSCDHPWPQPPTDVGRLKEKDLEARKGIALPITELEDTDIIKRFSSFNVFLRIGALCRRFVNNCRSVADHRRGGPISVEELNETLHGVLSLAQYEHFSPEFAALRAGKPIPRRSKLRHLYPVLQDGLIHVGGRLEHAGVPDGERNPFVLPSKHPLTWLIATSYHRQHLHCGPQLLLAVIRQQFWPLGGRNLTRDVVHKCVTCVKARPRNLVQLMGSLPAVRVTQSHIFENVGVDFAGPFYLKRPSPRAAPKKSYVAVFVCMATKATHLELVSELTTAAFIGSLRRFIARRGRPQNIYCDNATNFVGAGREVRNLFRSQQHRHSVSSETASQSIQFHFIPAKSPNFGGLWEACVKSMKHHLRRIIGNAFLPYEAFYTVLAQVEACLNSRPITPLSSDPNDMKTLTPGHFLIGRPLTALPARDYTAIPENRIRLWERVEAHTQHFWKRWHQEYLTTLQQRYKWSTVTRNLIVGSMVMIQEESLPVLKWSLGRVVDIHPGADGMVRVASVKLPSGTVTKRSISRLCILPVEVDPATLPGPSAGPSAAPSSSTGSTGDPGHLSASAGAAGPTQDAVSSDDED